MNLIFKIILASLIAPTFAIASHTLSCADNKVAMTVRIKNGQASAYTFSNGISGRFDQAELTESKLFDLNGEIRLTAINLFDSQSGDGLTLLANGEMTDSEPLISNIQAMVSMKAFGKNHKVNCSLKLDFLQ